MQANSASPVVSTKHLAHVDGWRALAALWVVLHHCYVSVHGQLKGVTALVLSVFSHGRVAVDVFIVISGYCLMLPVITNGGVLRGGFVPFIVRRAWRILPPYYFALAFSLLLNWLFIHEYTGTIWDHSLPVTPAAIGTHLLLIHDAFHGTYDEKINYVFWTIAVEWRIYFFFPLLVLAWRYLGPWITMLLGIPASWGLYHLSHYLIDSTLTLNYLGLFLAGMLAAAIVFSSSASLARSQKLPWEWITLLLAVTAVLLYLIPGVTNQIRDYGVGFCTMSALISTSLDRNAWHHRLLCLRPLVFIGSFSYSLYLMHAPLLQLLWQYAYAPLQPRPLWMLVVLLLSLPAVFGVSYLFFLLCERPFLQKRKNIVVATLPVLSGNMR